MTTATLSRKQREIQQRRQLIIDHARRILIEQGYLSLSMDRIAEATEYSKGTIYQHFSCKEDVVAALAVETGEKRAELFERASMFRGRSRERMMAVGAAADLFVRLYPQHFQTETIVISSSIGMKTSPELRETFKAHEQRCMSIAAGIVRDAIAQGDFEPAEGVTPEKLVFGLWTMTLGAMSVIQGGSDLEQMGMDHPLETLTRNYHAFLDGHGWRPLLADWDYEETRTRIQREVFADEFGQV